MKTILAVVFMILLVPVVLAVVTGSNTSITASTTQSQGQGALTKEFNNITTVANAGDAITLPAADTGLQIFIRNAGANSAQVFPASGDDLGAGVNNARYIHPTDVHIYTAIDTTTWISTIQQCGPFSMPSATVEIDDVYTVTIADHCKIITENDGSNIDITLPTYTAALNGMVVWICKTSSTGNDLLIDASGTDPFCGEASGNTELEEGGCQKCRPVNATVGWWCE